jgi:hypothetical protein
MTVFQNQNFPGFNTTKTKKILTSHQIQYFWLLCNIAFLLAPLLSSLPAFRMYLIAAGSAVSLPHSYETMIKLFTIT